MKHCCRLFACSLLFLASCGREDPAGQIVGRDPSGGADSIGVVSADEARRWLTYQYLIDEPGRAPEMVHALITSGWHTVNPEANALGVLSVFLGRLGAVHPDVLDAWAQAAAGPGATDEARMVFGYAVWDADPAGAPDRVGRIAGALPEDEAAALLAMTEGEPVDLGDLVPDTPGVLDFWWAAFMADGDTRWVDLVLGLIPPPEMSVEEAGLDDPQRLETARAAVWSLASNAAQHPRVMAHVRARLDGAGGDWPTVAEIIRMGEAEAAGNPPVLP